MMKQLYKYILTLATIFMATTLNAQTYNNGTWYSLYDETERRIATGIAWIDEDWTYSVFPPTQSPLTFDAKKQTAGGGDLCIYPIYNGSQKDYIFSENLSTSWETKSCTLTQEQTEKTTGFRFDRRNAVTLSKYFRNVKLPLAKHILLDDGTTYGTSSKSLSFGDIIIDNYSEGQKVDLRSFLTNNGSITIKSDNSAFRINSTSNTSGHTFDVGSNACASNNGTTGTMAGDGTLGDIKQYAFTIYFCPNEAKDYTATITITDGTDDVKATITVSGKGLKKDQQIVWTDKFAANEPSIPVGKEVSDAATATSGLPITYTSSDESIIAITNGGASFKAIKAGTATITATQAGDSKWNATSSNKTIKVTEKKIQYIKWNDNLTRFMTGDAPFTMTATAHILVNVETEETVEAPDRTSLITYTSANTNVVSVNGTILNIVGPDTTTVTATLPGDDTYEEAVVLMPVRVRQPSDECEAYVLDAPDEVKYSAPGGGEYAPAPWTAPAGKLTFEARIGNGTAVGDVIVQQYINGSWQNIDNFMPKTSWNTYSYDLNRDATRIRFYSNGSFNRFIKNVLVTQATYVESYDQGVKLNAGQAFILPKTTINTPSERSFELHWSTCDEEGIWLKSENDNFTVFPEFISSDTKSHGITIVTVKCTNPSPANTTVTGNIIITYDGIKEYKQPVSCEVANILSTKIVYVGLDQYPEIEAGIPYPFEVHDSNGNIVSGAKITLSTSDASLLSFDDDKIYPHCGGGKVTLTASYAGDENYKAAEPLSKEIIIPPCEQRIIWDQSFGSYTADENGHINETIVLNAYSNIGTPITYELDENAKRFSELIDNQDGTYSLHVFGTGDGYIYANATNCVIDNKIYTQAQERREIRIRKIGDPCNSYALSIVNEQSTHGWGTQHLIFPITGLPENTMTFGAHVNVGSVNNNLYIDFSKDGNTWFPSERNEFIIGEEYKWDYQCPVPDSVKYVRFETVSSLYTFFNMVTIMQKSYLTAREESINIPNTIVNTPFTAKFTIDYSDVPLIQYSVTNNYNLNIKISPDQPIDNNCGEYGTYTFTLTGMSPYPQENVTETITLYTSAGDKLEIPVTITARLSDIYYFNKQDGDWSDLNNWQVNDITPTSLPTPSNPVIITKAATIGTGNAPFEGIAYSITIEDGGSVTVLPQGGLTVHAGGFTGANEQNLTIHNMQSGAGFIRISPYFTKDVPGTMPKAKVLYQTKSTLDTGANKDATWQYIGAPGSDCSIYVDYNSWLYKLDEPNADWVLQPRTANVALKPFEGYAITQYGQPTYQWTAQLTNQSQTLPLTYSKAGRSGRHIFANSFAAPIDVKQLSGLITYADGQDSRFRIEQTVYIFNSGSWNAWNTKPQMGDDTPGQYYAIPILAAAADYLADEQTVIPPMQGFYMRVRSRIPTSELSATENVGQILLDYNKLVMGNQHELNTPLRLPQRVEATPDFQRVRMYATSANSGADRLYVIQDTINTRKYNNGYDAPNQETKGLVNIYTNESFGKMEVSCSDNIDSLYIGFMAGEDSNYTLHFGALCGEIYLKDLENDSIFLMQDGGQYSFTATPNSTNDLRFQILLHPDIDPFPGNGDINSSINNIPSMQVWMDDNTIYIANAPINSAVTLFNISGHAVLTTPIHYTPYSLNLSHMPQGVYVLKINNEAYKFVCK